ncbi:swr complex subunit [Rhizina undulata]
MSGFQDVRDVMAISTSDTPKPPPAKKQKTVEKRPDGITRELFALLGENPPPVAIVENKFKEKPKWTGKAIPWEHKAFINPARTDGLVLRHWEKKTDAPANEPDLTYRFAKFNVNVDVPEYTDGEYEVLKDADWTREETDYLLDLCREFDLRFVIIWDRYEYPGKTRTVEDLKARYYSVYRSLMELRTPLNQMTPEQAHMFNLLNFDKEREIARKKMATVLFNRTPEQAKEEELLLVELKRILTTQSKTLEERRDLFARLEAPPSQGSIAAYTGSQGLAHLKEMMASSSDKNKKRKSLAISTHQESQPSPATTATPSTATAMEHKTKEPPAKKQVKKFTDDEERHFGISHHDKLSSGVKFRSAMVQSNVKGGTAQKIQQALAQLDIAQRLTMPTARTVAKFEMLQTGVGLLLDTKKLMDKVEAELKVLKAQQELKEKGDS